MNDQQNLPFVIGIDIGGTQVRAAVLQGTQLISRVDILTGNDPVPNHLIPQIYRAVQQALDAAAMNMEDMAGIGIGGAGVLESQTGCVFSPNLVGWDHVPLLAIFHQQDSVPIFIQNDANAGGAGADVGVAWAAPGGIPVGGEIIGRAAEGLGIGLGNIIHIFNPEIIALGGGVIQIGPLFLEPAYRIVQQRALEVPATTARIVIATLGADVGLIGAGTLVYMNQESHLPLLSIR